MNPKGGVPCTSTSSRGDFSTYAGIARLHGAPVAVRLRCHPGRAQRDRDLPDRRQRAAWRRGQRCRIQVSIRVYRRCRSRIPRAIYVAIGGRSTRRPDGGAATRPAAPGSAHRPVRTGGSRRGPGLAGHVDARQARRGPGTSLTSVCARWSSCAPTGPRGSCCRSTAWWRCGCSCRAERAVGAAEGAEPQVGGPLIRGNASPGRPGQILRSPVVQGAGHPESTP